MVFEGLMVEDDDDKFGRFGFGSIRFQMWWWLDLGWVVVHGGGWFGGGDGWFTVWGSLISWVCCVCVW